MTDNYKVLIKRYTQGRTICNCGLAYLKNCGMGHTPDGWKTDLPVCKDGCSTNQIATREYIATMVLREIVENHPDDLLTRLLNEYRLQEINNGDMGIYLKSYNIRVATIHHNCSDLVEILKGLFKK